MNKLGSTIIRFDTVTSTNDIARQMAQRGEDEGLAVTARAQTAGRGRKGRQWSSPAGKGLYLSLVLRPRINPVDASLIPLAAAIAVSETLRFDFHVETDIKWPNDLLARGRKICGILVESAIEGQELQYAILGIGINVLQREFPAEIAESATSILIESAVERTTDEVMSAVLPRLDLWYRESLSRPDTVIARWEKLSSYARGREVTVISSQGEIEGTTRGLTRRGSLMVEIDGRMREFFSGEVTLRNRQSAKAQR
ncbi:MAG: biotin--[acetyl-CoA-carboxylase] ligase [Acidobacteriota bacterium]